MSLEDRLFELATCVRDLTLELAIYNQACAGGAQAAPAKPAAAQPANTAAPAAPAKSRSAAKPAAAAAPAAAGADPTPEQLKAARVAVRDMMQDLAKDQVDTLLGKYAPDAKLASVPYDKLSELLVDAKTLVDAGLNLDGDGDAEDPLAV